jgi:hypothetical protein
MVILSEAEGKALPRDINEMLNENSGEYLCRFHPRVILKPNQDSFSTSSIP